MIAVRLQHKEQPAERLILRRMEISCDTKSFIAKDGSVALVDPLKFDWATESSLFRVQSGQLMLIMALRHKTQLNAR